MNLVKKIRSKMKKFFLRSLRRLGLVGADQELIKKYRQEIKKLKSRITCLSQDIDLILRLVAEKDEDLLKIVDKQQIEKLFSSRVNYNLKMNPPETFSEKIQWLKLHRRTPEMTTIADKYEVRSYIKKMGLDKYLNELYGVYDSVDEFKADLHNLPDRFVIKANHNSGGVVIVKQKSLMDEKDLDRLQRQLNTNYYYKYSFNEGKAYRNGEWCYKDIVPKIICEKFIEDINGELPDYKFHCFDGEPALIQYDTGRFSTHKRAMFDVDWNLLDFRLRHELPNELPKKPKKLQEMLDLCRKLSGDFEYLRVDLYVIDDTQLVFGEMTFFPGSGVEEWKPREWDYKVGSMIKLGMESDSDSGAEKV